jgi:hypothetical protein
MRALAHPPTRSTHAGHTRYTKALELDRSNVMAALQRMMCSMWACNWYAAPRRSAPTCNHETPRRWAALPAPPPLCAPPSLHLCPCVRTGSSPYYPPTPFARFLSTAAPLSSPVPRTWLYSPNRAVAHAARSGHPLGSALTRGNAMLGARCAPGVRCNAATCLVCRRDNFEIAFEAFGRFIESSATAPFPYVRDSCS